MHTDGAATGERLRTRADEASTTHMNATQYANVLNGELRYLRTGSGPTIVLLHTLRTQLEYFHPVVRALGPGFDIVAPDLPGHGRSTAPAVEYDATYFTDAIERFLDVTDVRDVTLVGESIGGSIALGLAARRNPRVARVVALNPYDYGSRGGIRRSSPLANVLITAMQWPVIGEIVLAAGTPGILRRVVEGGFYDRRKLSPTFLQQLWECGALPGHARAFLSLSRQWRSWNEARAAYANIVIPVTLVYAEHDWSRREDRDANSRVLSTARTVALPACGHFASLELPEQVASIIRDH
jgi:pimeloyl-ACP methyl ester carboxylesterase